LQLKKCNLQVYKNNMKAKFFLFTILIITLFVSCSDNEQTEEPIQTYNRMIIDTAVANKTSPDSSFIKSLMQRSAGARSLTGLPENTPQNNNSALPVNNNARLNPAHGQPGHRCDVSVGAPLNSNPLPVNTSAPQPLPVTTATPVAQQVTTGMNPAHGQPNHRCDIAVGAPLNSKPAQKNTATSIVNTTSSAASPSPAIQKVADGMNPSHGQPGHRCDIAVGAPLNSKPAPPALKPIAPEPAKGDTAKN
jgi:hypothetical protein